VNPSTTTTYTVVTSNGSGCTASAISTVTVSLPPVASANGATVCAGQSAMLTASGGANYSWSDGETTSSIIITPTAASTYTVFVSNGSCKDTANASVLVNPSPAAAAYSNVTITHGQSTTLAASGGTSYSWNNGNAGANITVTPFVTTIYCVTVVNSFGCHDSACVKVTVKDIDCSVSKVGELFIPNAFSPNGDGDNDRIKLLYGNYSCIDTYSFIVYNRWGEKVFETIDPAAEWDGSYKGSMEGSAVFVYYMKATLISGEEVVKKGNISLVR
jgi:gliding motility-associated-like protein